MGKFISFLHLALTSISLTAANLNSNIPECGIGFAEGEGDGNSEFLGYADDLAQCILMTEIFRASNNSAYNGASLGMEGLCDAIKGMSVTNGDPYIQTCFLPVEGAIENLPNNAEAGSHLPNNAEAGSQGDPIIIGLKGQVFKFEGTNGKWYSNLAAKDFSWNMRFRKFETCPRDEDMFISGMSITDSSMKHIGHTSNILIATTSSPIRECVEDSALCLGGGTLHISFDGGHTFVSHPGDYHPTPGSRLIAHNTYAACSRKWFDYEITKKKEKAARALRGFFSRGRRAAVNVEKSPIQLLSEKQSTMINQLECGSWIRERKEKDDLFKQRGLWSTIYIETPLAAFHIEYRQSNPDRVDRVCDFQSLDAWVSKVSDELESQEWNGILGETRKVIYDPVSGQQIKTDRSQLLRGKNDVDYEVDGPFGLTHAALGYNTTWDGLPITSESVVIA